MFTIKAFARGRFVHTGYEALWYSVNETSKVVQFETPTGAGADRLRELQLGEDYVRIVVENATGRTVENLYMGRQEAMEAEQ